MKVTVRLNWFYSQGDEDRFFAALDEHRAIRAVQAIGSDLIIDLDVRRLGRQSLWDLVALFYRYGITLRPLKDLAERSRFAWLRDRKKFWYRSMFVADRR